MQKQQVTMSYTAAGLLKTTVSFTGEKTVNERGQEVNAPRCLNGEESSQRRHFLKAFEGVKTPHNEELQTIFKAHNEKIQEVRSKLEQENVKGEGEDDNKYSQRIDGLLATRPELAQSAKEMQNKVQELNKKEYTFELTQKTLDFLKKYFTEYSEKVGFMVGDDEAAAELIDLFSE